MTPRAGGASGARGEAVEAGDVRPQRRRNRHGAVGVLVVLQHGDDGAADGEAGAVQGVAEVRLATALRLEADVDAATAEVGVVRAGRDLAVLALSRQPDLEVVALGGAEADVARAALDD